MKYWIGSDLTKSIKDDNQSSFINYTELGWECAVGRLKVIRMISSGIMKETDSIITTKDRIFMYPFCNVEIFNNIPSGNDIKYSPDNYGDFLGELHCGHQGPYRWPEDLNLIKQFDFENIDVPPCIVINHRVRNWCSTRNCKEKDTVNTISMILSLGLKPYISGWHADKVDERAEYIPTLKKLASIVNHNNCIAFFASGGTVMLGQQCCKNKLVCLRTCDISDPYFEHPLYMSKYLQFSPKSQHLIAPDDINGLRQVINN